VDGDLPGAFGRPADFKKILEPDMNRRIPLLVLFICFVDAIIGLIFLIASGWVIQDLLAKKFYTFLNGYFAFLFLVSLPLLGGWAFFSAGCKTYKLNVHGLKENQTLFWFVLFLGIILLTYVYEPLFISVGWGWGFILLAIIMKNFFRIPFVKKRFN